MSHPTEQQDEERKGIFAFPTSSLIFDSPLCRTAAAASAAAEASASPPSREHSPHLTASHPSTLSDANFPKDQEGRVYHLGIKKGEVNNRILSVGSASRAASLAELLDESPPVFTLTSHRGFTIYSGTRKGVPVSIIATGMGIAMMDFVVRETAALIDGPMAIARYGTCGTIRSDVPVGSVSVARLGSVMIQRNPDAFGEDAHGEVAYRISRPVPADGALSALIHDNMCKALGDPSRVVAGMNATADSFYSSQGRVGSVFDDKNEELIDQLALTHPDVVTLEMETFHVMDLARCSYGKIRAGAATIVLAQRKSNDWLQKEELVKLEKSGGQAVLDALAEIDL
eukprot:TRINITY_DN13420_c0_g1_i1.p1 TRINITY_DN13420_c0_g1~~TRINITY_DN13420_c0_g1_i1.p1  ORF type:complete len:342 (+),score=100.94 TRINITY_DN13420_c0_g1_i1:49-1074(+)